MLNYQYVINPITNRKVSIHTNTGKKIINQYAGALSFQELKQRASTRGPAPKPKRKRNLKKRKKERTLKQLVDMGFDGTMSLQALEQVDNTEEAIDLIQQMQLAAPTVSAAQPVVEPETGQAGERHESMSDEEFKTMTELFAEDSPSWLLEEEEDYQPRRLETGEQAVAAAQPVVEEDEDYQPRRLETGEQPSNPELDRAWHLIDQASFPGNQLSETLNDYYKPSPKGTIDSIIQSTKYNEMDQQLVSDNIYKLYPHKLFQKIPELKNQPLYPSVVHNSDFFFGKITINKTPKENFGFVAQEIIQRVDYIGFSFDARYWFVEAVEIDSAAWEAGLRPFDMIWLINNNLTAYALEPKEGYTRLMDNIFTFSHSLPPASIYPGERIYTGDWLGKDAREGEVSLVLNIIRLHEKIIPEDMEFRKYR